MTKSVSRLMAVFALSVSMLAGHTQPLKTETKPYKVLTSGKQLTIKSSRNIKHVMLWTTGGDRVVEQRDVNNNSLTIDIPISRKTFFLMVGLENGKIYTEKIGVQ
ncbi:MAG: hypothetical protein U0U70_13830 [Chitinophagaceae bacterium]